MEELYLPLATADTDSSGSWQDDPSSTGKISTTTCHGIVLVDFGRLDLVLMVVKLYLLYLFFHL
ncbi:hypothetical protein A2Z54_00610 [Candidatus Curtissbacteria bacterium RIFCSPHIGHO2_02_39_8]|nr:MAG: hypothetical protein A2Z54_00610 [Candidatus Curtissbacteria bacterium RIFCSPHIGHO2_02_39_8]